MANQHCDFLLSLIAEMLILVIDMLGITHLDEQTTALAKYTMRSIQCSDDQKVSLPAAQC